MPADKATATATAAIIEAERDPWMRMDGEPTLWFARFDHYRKQGPTRTVARTYHWTVMMEEEQHVSAQTGTKTRPNHRSGWWQTMYEKWQWKRRAEAWDMAELARLDREEMADRKRERKMRRDLVASLRGKIIVAMTGLDPSQMQHKDLIAATQLVLREGRAEWDDEPTQRVVQQANTVVSGNISITDTSDMTEDEVREHLAGLARAAAAIGAGNPFGTRHLAGDAEAAYEGDPNETDHT